jgi:predicted phage baseplate assembly protein
LRSLNFNTTLASNLRTVAGERLGRGNGQPGQSLPLTQGNIAAGSLTLVARTADNTLHPWTEIADFDTAGPDDTVFVLDAEAGLVIFGSGVRGRPPLATELIIASTYRFGGGLAGEVPTGAVSQPTGLPTTVGAAFNVTPARGGRNAETLDAAKLRAPHAFRARGRAVTAADYVDAAIAAPGVRIARAAVVPLRRPYPAGHLIAGLPAPGIDLTTELPGALSVIVVPDALGPYPLPTTGELTSVAAYLDTIRLITTEVHVTTPQYVRLHNLLVVVRAEPGFTQTLLRETIGDALSRRFHVLTGGPDGAGVPFGAGLHHADLVAAVIRVAGVDRVEDLTCLADGRTPDGADQPLLWRLERRKTVRLTNCPKSDTDTDRLVLLPDEVPFVDPASLTVTVIGAP